MHAPDIVIVGGGLSGCVAATLLGRAGYNITILDRHDEYPADFRVEQLVGEQVHKLHRLGVLEGLVAGIPQFDHATTARRGRVIERVYEPHYGLRYEAMIKAARAQLPSTVKLAVGQVVDIKTSPTWQQVHLASGETIDCRLVVLATGHEKGLLNKLAISRRTICNDHSLAIGFDIVADTGNPLEGSVLVHYGDEIRDRMDYIKIFPLPDALRANLFCFQGISEPWSRNFRHRPREMLLQVMPGLQRFIPDFDIPGKVQIRTNHLIEAEDYLRDGLVLIGDAFKISCPAAGAGVTRLLTDVDRLCNVHVPRWLAKSDTSIEQIGQFYTDPVKRACDIQAARLGEYRRAVSVETSLSWRLHRATRHAYRVLRGRLTSGRHLTAPKTTVGFGRKQQMHPS